MRKMSAHLAQAGDALARTERVLILTQAQVDGALAQVRALRVENDELAADVLALEHANSPQKSVWDARRLGLRPLRGAAAARLSRRAAGNGSRQSASSPLHDPSQAGRDERGEDLPTRE